MLRLIQRPERLSSYRGWWAGVGSLWKVSLDLRERGLLLWLPLLHGASAVLDGATLSLFPHPPLAVFMVLFACEWELFIFSLRDKHIKS